MKSQKFKRVIVVLLVTAMAVALPSSLAKYAETKNYTMTLTKHQSWQFNTYQYSETVKELQGWSYVNVTYQRLSNGKIALPYAGRYVIIAKGGDGAKGLAWSAQEQAHDYDVDGGVGGTVVGVYTTTKDNQYLYVAPGFAGANQSNGKKGSGGTNVLNKFGGGAGGAFEVDWWDAFEILGKLLSQEPAGGGGGAATVVYRCDANGNYSDADLLIIAGGGGGSPSWNQRYQNTPIGVGILSVPSYTKAPGQGGMGGSNFGTVTTKSSNSSDEYNVSSALNAYCKTSYDLYYGVDGTGSSESYNHFGTGGTNTGGLTGKASKSCADMVDAITSVTNGSDFNNNGNGAPGYYYAGGGGGGYCGGGGGNGTGIDRPAGGAGGGSSYVSSLINQDISINYSAYIFEAAAKTEKPIPSQDHPGVLGANEGNGYVIIKYLGPAEEVESPNIITLDDILDKVNSICKSYPNKSEISNTSTKDDLYKALVADSDVMLLLSNRAWRVTTDANGLSTLQFTNNRSATIGNGTSFWRYDSDGTWKTGSAYRKSLVSAWGYPNSWNNSTKGFVLN